MPLKPSIVRFHVWDLSVNTTKQIRKSQLAEVLNGSFSIDSWEGVSESDWRPMLAFTTISKVG